ncbi:hypothetical protein D9M68_986540 [compost metagenome]
MAEGLEGAQVAARAAAEIENPVGRLGLDMAEQGGDVLADIVVAGARAEFLGAVLIMGQGEGADPGEFGGSQGHRGKPWAKAGCY